MGFLGQFSRRSRFEAAFDKAISSYKEMRLNDAAEGFALASRLKPDHWLTQHNLGVVYLQLQRYEEAARCFAAAINLNPGHCDDHFNLGVVCLELQRSEDAIGHLKEAVRLEPEHCEAHYNLGLAYKKLQRFEEAIGSFKESIRIRPDRQGVRHQMGTVFQALGRNQDAAQSFRNELRLDPGHPEAHSMLDLALANLAPPCKSIETLAGAHLLEPDPYGGHAEDNSDHSEYYETRLEELRDAVRLKPSDPQACSELATAFMALGRLHDAIKELNRGLQLDPHRVHMWLSLAEAYVAGQQYDRAVEAFRQAFRLDAKLPPLWLVKLGRTHELLRQYEDAASAYSQADRIVPWSEDTLIRLGLVQFRLGLYERAAQTLKNAVRANRMYYYNVQALCYVGIAYARLGLYAEALQAFEQSLLKRETVAAHYNKGIVHLILGDAHSALDECEGLTKKEALGLSGKLFDLIC